ncbi:MAG: nucleoside hydrolase [Candidatus Poribacteria bacterium]|nr:nucleoside hydrolase [Candidatus Poribacteria bacterium]
MQKIRMILDNDIGGDIDDVLALAFALNSPEIELMAVTTVNTDPPMRARIAAKMLQTFGRPEVRVAPGLKAQFDGSQTQCKDINGAVVLTLDDPVPRGDGVALMIDTVRTHPNEITIVGIGCWTNIAQALKQAPDLLKIVDRLVLMGGQISPPGPESNVICDPSAAAYLFDLPLPKLLVPLDVTRHCRYTASRHGGLFSRGEPRTNLVRDLLRAWQIGRYNGDPQREPILHDPLAVALTFDPSLIQQSEPMCLRIEFGEDHSRPITRAIENGTPNIEVVTAVDRQRFEDLFAQRIVGHAG